MNLPDYDLESLARHLHLAPEVVAKMAERGKLPGRRIAGQWKFAAADIHHWWEERIGLSDEGELMEVEQTFQRQDAGDADEPFTIGDLLPIEAVSVPLPARTKGSVVKEMVALAARAGLVWDASRMEDAVRARETLHPTALDNGVALLHPRRPLPSIVGDPFLALGVTAQSLPFGHARGQLTDIFFLIGSTDDRTHLRVLARLSRLLADSTLLQRLRQADGPYEAREALVERERELFA